MADKSFRHIVTPIAQATSTPSEPLAPPAMQTQYVSPANAGFDWTRQVHRALRGRYRFTFIIASLIAVIGFSIGWEWTGLQYRSEGMVRIASVLPPVLKATDQNQAIPMFDSFIQAQQELVTSRTVLEAAAKDPSWTTPSLAPYRLTVDELASGLKVDVRAKSENLRISFTGSHPQVAMAAVRTTVAAFQDAYTRDHAEREQRRLNLLEDYRRSLSSQLEAMLADPTNVSSRSSPTTQSAVSQAASNPAMAPRRPTAMSLAMIDPEMRRIMELRTRAAEQIDRDRINYGPNHPEMLKLKLDYELANRRVERYIDQFYHAQLARFDDLQGKVDGEVSTSLLGAPTVSPAVVELRREIEDVSQRIEILTTEAAMPKRFEIVKNGDFPVVVPDRRIKTAAMAAMGGAGLAVALMVIAGLFRREYHYCADVVDDLASYSPYVAAIPDLARNDFRCVADAVQCIHHLRQTLDTKSRVYMVSSATSGSGQSSVLMALALSLAASGNRTLVIDADFISRGLSKSLKLDNEVGFLDVLSGCELEYCIKTNRHGLNILPLGLNSEVTGMAFTQTQVANLIEQAKSRFDVILIDAPPVLMCAETGLMASAADGVLITLSRGQTRKTVVRAITELQQARGTIIGAVFNRVARKDFDLSIPQRARPLGAASTYRLPEHLAELSPLVSAMAKTMRTPLELARYVDVNPLTLPRYDIKQQMAESVAA
jgi:Mrp family chromosome partitioning ATPase